MPRFGPSRQRRDRMLVATVLIALFTSSNLVQRMQAATGDLDSTFGNAGKVVTDFFGNSDEARSVVVQPDGKIMVAGFVFSTTTRADFGLARYDNSGNLDTTFGSGGKVTTDFSNIPSGSSVDIVNAAVLQADGKFVLAGSAGIGVSSFGLARYNGDGGLDSSFGSGGRVTTAFSQFDAIAGGVAIQPDGKIVAAGGVNTSSSSNRKPDFSIARYKIDGTLDSTFGVGGKVTTDFDGVGDTANGVAVQTDGKIVVVGYRQVSLMAPLLTQFAIARYNTNGSLDATFGAGGKLRPFFFGGTDQVTALAVLPGGKIIISGIVTNNPTSGSDFTMIRLNSDGSMDSAFGSAGEVMTDFSSGIDSAFAMAIQPDGKIILAGFAETGTSTFSFDFALARYNADGSLDTDFAAGGKSRTDFFTFSSIALDIAVQQDGKIVAAGRVDTGIVGDFALARFNGTSFDICLQDESSANFFEFNSTTADYRFTNCGGVTIGGTGVISRRGSIITLQQNGPDRRVLARSDGGVNKGTASVQVFSQGTTFTISDRNTLNNTCSCGAH